MKTHRIAAAIAAIVLPLLAADAQAAELKAPVPRRLLVARMRSADCLPIENTAGLT
jgi:hypothetical protein